MLNISSLVYGCLGYIDMLKAVVTSHPAYINISYTYVTAIIAKCLIRKCRLSPL